MVQISLDCQEAKECLGYARLNISSLDFEHSESHVRRPISEQNVLRLLRVFRTEGCHREQTSHFLKVLITPDQKNEIHTSNQAARVLPSLSQGVPSSWKTWPTLSIGSVVCLNGLHRIEAAKQYLDKNDQWWTVILYADALPTSCRTKIVEDFENEQANCDGEIFRKIRLYNMAGDEQAEKKWWARLSESKRKDLRQLLKNDQFKEAFDNLLHWPGLWSPIRLGSFHRLLTMKCDEELLNYLHHINESWSILLDGVQSLPPEAVDNVTVGSLEALVPQRSSTDAASIKRLMRGRTIFSKLMTSEQRDRLLTNILAYEYMIPSLMTFFESLKYLEPCTKILRGLLPPRQRKTIREGLFSYYFYQETFAVEYRSHDVRSIPSVASDYDREAGYHQLWLYALRNFTSMTDATPRKEACKEKPRASTPSPAKWKEFSQLAYRVGFKTEAAETWMSEDSEMRLAEQIVEKAGHDVDNVEAVSAIGQILKQMQRKGEDPKPPVPCSHNFLALERRVGRPFEDDHERDQNALFIPYIYKLPTATRAEVSTFYCKWDVIVHFLGILRFVESHAHGLNLDVPPPPSDLIPHHVPDHSHELANQSHRDAQTIQTLRNDLISIQASNKEVLASEQNLRSRLANAEAMLLAERAKAPSQETNDKLSTALGKVRSLETAYMAAQEQIRNAPAPGELSLADAKIIRLEKAISEAQERLRKAPSSDELSLANAEIERLGHALSHAQEQFREAKSELLRAPRGSFIARIQEESVTAVDERLRAEARLQQVQDQTRALEQQAELRFAQVVAENETLKAQLQNVTQQQQESTDRLDDARYDQEVALDNAKRQHEGDMKDLQRTFSKKLEEQEAFIHTLQQLGGENTSHEPRSSETEDQSLTLRFVSVNSANKLDFVEKIFSRKGAEDMLTNFRAKLHLVRLWTGRNRQVVVHEGNVDYIIKAWCHQKLLWVVPLELASDIDRRLKPHQGWSIGPAEDHGVDFKFGLPLKPDSSYRFESQEIVALPRVRKRPANGGSAGPGRKRNTATRLLALARKQDILLMDADTKRARQEDMLLETQQLAVTRRQGTVVTNDHFRGHEMIESDTQALAITRRQGSIYMRDHISGQEGAAGQQLTTTQNQNDSILHANVNRFEEVEEEEEELGPEAAQTVIGIDALMDDEL